MKREITIKHIIIAFILALATAPLIFALILALTTAEAGYAWTSMPQKKAQRCCPARAVHLGNTTRPASVLWR